MRHPSLCVSFALAAALASQSTNPIGYPSDTVRAGSGNLAPLGFNPSVTTYDEARWQQLIPARLLPTTPGLITGLATNCQSSNSAMKYTSLKITLSHTTATTLGTSASGNLPGPLPVFSATDYTVTWSINNWVTIPFQIPFPYNGTDSIVISIQKVWDRVTNPVPGIVTHQTNGFRPDLDPARFAFSPFGGGGSTTDTLTNSSGPVLSLRLNTVTQATTTLASVTQPNGSEFSINTNMLLTVWGATGTAWGLVLDTAYRTPISLGFIQGRLLISPSLLLTTGTTSGGSSALTFPIPNDPSLVNSYWVFQSVTASPTANLAFTNAIDFFVKA